MSEERKVLADLLQLIDDGVLVRNTRADLNQNWAMKCLPLVMTLQKARAVVNTAPAAPAQWVEENDITKLLDYEADEEGVRRFALVMTRKLAQKRSEGYCGWNDPHECTEGRLWEMMVDHIKKGDPVDIANFAMMVWNRRNPRALLGVVGQNAGERTALPVRMGGDAEADNGNQPVESERKFSATSDAFAESASPAPNESRSILRRKAAQRGEPAPVFPAPNVATAPATVMTEDSVALNAESSGPGPLRHQAGQSETPRTDAAAHGFCQANPEKMPPSALPSPGSKGRE